uniref:Uncharacterized protein n=1 Tax=Corethron hystrix TaxID=216773 RepID=A0A7S1C1V6_9STRA
MYIYIKVEKIVQVWENSCMHQKYARLYLGSRASYAEIGLQTISTLTGLPLLLETDVMQSESPQKTFGKQLLLGRLDQKGHVDADYVGPGGDAVGDGVGDRRLRHVQADLEIVVLHGAEVGHGEDEAYQTRFGAHEFLDDPRTGRDIRYEFKVLVAVFFIAFQKSPPGTFVGFVCT